MYDFQYELEGGEGTRNKIVFISWSPDEGALVMVILAPRIPAGFVRLGPPLYLLFDPSLSRRRSLC